MLHLLYGKTGTGLTAVAGEIGSRFREIMVDEYQDSNGVQDAIFMALTNKRNNCFMVGDVKQSIYQFRLADPTIFLEKYGSYKPAETAEEGFPRKVLLSSNFRSAGEVIGAVNDVFTSCMTPDVGGLYYGDDEMLREGRPHKTQNEPEIEFIAVDVQQDTYYEEAMVVADRICQLLDGTHTIRDGDGFRPIKPEDIVILLRSPGSVGAEYCYALESRGIRCTIGSSVDLFQTEEVRVLHCLLQTIHNPMLDIPLIAVLGSRVFGFTADDLSTIRSKATSISFYQALKRDDSEKTIAFLETLDQLRAYARMNSVCSLLQKINTETRMDSIFAAMNDGVERTANLQSFMQFAASYEATGNKELGQFLDHLQIVAEKGMTVSAEQNVPGFVTIMSIHKSKGLEFPVVFLSALSRRFNHESATAQVLCDKEMGLGLSCVDQKNRVRYPSIAKRAISAKIMADSVSEELRVLYVAMTRACDRLIMTYAAKNIEKDVAEIACRIDFSEAGLLSADVSCPGQWILQAAVKRTEAGMLQANTVNPDCIEVSEHPWKISLVQGSAEEESSIDESEIVSETLDPDVLKRMEENLRFDYAYQAATTAPSKQTATQLKGRTKDMEAAEHTGKNFKPLLFRKPSFVSAQMDATGFGNAVHRVMQYISFEQCTCLEGVRDQIQRLANDGYIDTATAELIDAEMIFSFFKTETGRQFVRSSKLLREFKFSVLVDGENYYAGGYGDKVLLQGVVDCAMIESDGITVVDFKTDKITPETIDQVTDQYRLQVTAYVDALTRIYNKPVKAAYLYFFNAKELVKI